MQLGGGGSSLAAAQLRRRQRGGSTAAAAAVAARRGRRQLSGSGAAAAAACAEAMFPLFITHDEYFVRCGGSGGGSTMFLICPATNFLVDKNSVKYGLRTEIVPQEGCMVRGY